MQKVFKVGNSRGVTIPKAYADQLGLEEGRDGACSFAGERTCCEGRRKKKIHS